MGLPTWAALSVSYFTTMALPELPLAAEVVIAADNDNNKAGIKAAEQAAALWSSQGRRNPHCRGGLRRVRCFQHQMQGVPVDSFIARAPQLRPLLGIKRTSISGGWMSACSQ